MTSAIRTARSLVADAMGNEAGICSAPLSMEDSIVGPSCGASMYVQHERTPPIQAKYTRNARRRNGVGDGITRLDWHRSP